MVGAGRVAWLLMMAWHSAKSRPFFRGSNQHPGILDGMLSTLSDSLLKSRGASGRCWGGARVLAYLSGTTVEFQNDCTAMIICQYAQHYSLAVKEKLVGGRTSMGLTAFEMNCKIPFHHFLSEPPIY